MKTKLFILAALNLFVCSYLLGQNITNTLGTGGVFSIKDGSTTYLTLFQSDGLVGIANNLTLTETPGSETGILFKGADRFLHTFHPSSTDGYNTFLGLNSGNFTLTGSGPQASYNTGIGSYSLSALSSGSRNSAFGYNSLLSNSSGLQNSAFGYNSLYSNTTASYNSAFGSFSLRSNTTAGYNSAFGYSSLFSNTSGTNNSAFGYNSLNSNTTAHFNSAFGNFSLNSNSAGEHNSAFGYYSLYNNTLAFYNSSFGSLSLLSNTIGSFNSAFGYSTLYSNSTGTQNSAFGYSSLYSNSGGYGNSAFGYNSLYSTTGYNNTAIGDHAGFYITTGSNNIAIGYNAQIFDGTYSNLVRIGNTGVTYASIQVAWSVTSDKRWKKNITPIKPGLDFISKLNPVSYTRISDDPESPWEKTEYGFIAQEIEGVLKELNIDKSGMVAIDSEGRYELRYNDLFAPITKAIQELKQENDELKTEIEFLKNQNKKLAELELLYQKLSEKIENIKVSGK